MLDLALCEATKNGFLVVLARSVAVTEGPEPQGTNSTKSPVAMMADQPTVECRVWLIVVFPSWPPSFGSVWLWQ